ncbi:uncharacterized protein N7483_007256 [Penicillium malachiteum]|uniref:uncharacterized protein n=1 Tax=Penicillium malachiteum TaxID=1324776 RepID=UPI00254870CF|nr:uncharacterized protein N7483_007256 [Penicillium malachiteum]KAJ5725899.1 hypothetical protein N7483_007256 [Penicillium malachiteum]
MDPISITSLILDVSDIVNRLIQYGKDVKGAKSDMRKLSEELFALRGILDHLSAQKSLEPPAYQEVESESSIPSNEEVMIRVLQTTKEFLDSLLKDLEPAESKLKNIKQKLEWPFTQEKVNAHLTRLERVKSWLILVLTADHAAVERDLQQEIGNLARSLTEDMRIRERERIQIANRELFQWMAPVSPANYHLRATQASKIASGKWFIGSHLKHWLRYGKRNMFFLVGKSGTGKTTLFAQCVDELTLMAAQNPNLSFAYFYCTMSDAASQIPVNILGSLIAQLSGSDASILDNIRSLYDSIPKSQAHKRPVDIAVLEDAIIKYASGQTQVVIFIDAINESHDPRNIESSLLRFAELATNIRVLVTTSSTMVLPQDSKADMLNISADMMSGDIQAYINHRVETDDTMRDLKPELKSEIREKLLKDADGSFRWTQLSMDNLCTQRTARAMRQALQNLPGTLREIYASALERVSIDDRYFVREALFWVCFAQDQVFANRYLTLEVINEAVVIDEECSTLDEDMMLVPPHILLDLCQGFIAQDKSGFVTLAHSSIKDFLTSDWIKSSRVSYFSLDPTTANAIMMRKCLTYLCLHNFKCGYAPKSDVYTRFKRYKGLHYAAFTWPKYAAVVKIGDVERSLVKKFFDTRHLPRQGNFGAWMQTLMPTVNEATIAATHPLYYAASWGMNSVINMLLEVDPDIDINAPGGRVGATAVFAAGNRQNFDTVELLLRAGADPTIHDPETCYNVFDLSLMSKWSGLREPLSNWLSDQDPEIQKKYRQYKPYRL